MANQAPLLFVLPWDQRSLRFLVDEDVPDYDNVCRQITQRGGTLLTTPNTADIVLVAEDTAAQQYLLAEREEPHREPVILYCAWVQESIAQGKIMDARENWGQCRVMVDGLGLPRMRASNGPTDVAGGGPSQASSSNAPLHYPEPSGRSEASRHGAFACGSGGGFVPAQQANLNAYQNLNIPSSNQPPPYAMPPQPSTMLGQFPQNAFAAYPPGGYPVAPSAPHPQAVCPQQPYMFHPYDNAMGRALSTAPNPTMYIPPPLVSPMQNALTTFSAGLARANGLAIQQFLFDIVSLGTNARVDFPRANAAPPGFHPLNIPLNAASSHPMRPNVYIPNATYPLNPSTNEPAMREIDPRNSRANTSSSNRRYPTESAFDRKKTRFSHPHLADDDDNVMDDDMDLEEDAKPARPSKFGPIRSSRGRKSVPHAAHSQNEVELDETLPVPHAVPADVGCGNKFTPEDQDYFCTQLKHVLDSQEDVTIQAFTRAVAEMAPHHSQASWRRWYSKGGEKQQIIKEAARMEESNRKFIRKKTRVYGGKGKERAST